MRTLFEDLSVELIYEIFLYFQYDEVWNIFCELNSRFVILMKNMSFMPIYLGLNGMSIARTEFYYTHLSQPNVCNSLISLYVSDKFAFDNGLWLSSHLSTFINLRHLSLIDIKRSTFELILNSLSPMDSLNLFRVNFSSFDRAHYTFLGIPEGVYYEQIFRLFPSLHVCHLSFKYYMHHTIDSQFVLSSDRPFLPIQTSLSNLKVLQIECSIYFLSHLLEHLPQLEQLNYKHTDLWLPRKHPLRNNNNLRVIPIDKRLAPNLRRLKIVWYGLITLKSLTEFFEYDVLFSLTKFTLFAIIDGPHVLRNLLPMFSSQCLYSFGVIWFVESSVSLSETSKILSDTFQQLKGSVPIELELSIENNENSYFIRARTLPSMKKCLEVDSYLNERTVRGQSRWPYKTHVLNTQLFRCHEIIMTDHYDEKNDKFLSFSPAIVPWHQITSFCIIQPFNSTRLHYVISEMTNIRKLELHYQDENDLQMDWQRENFVKVVDDCSLCNILMSNGLRQLNLFTTDDNGKSNWINIANLIIERLYHLQIIELHGMEDQLIQMTHILINGLSKLDFFTFVGNLEEAKINEKKIRDLQNSNTRSFRTEVPNTTDYDRVFIWL